MRNFLLKPWVLYCTHLCHGLFRLGQSLGAVLGSGVGSVVVRNVRLRDGRALEVVGSRWEPLGAVGGRWEPLGANVEVNLVGELCEACVTTFPLSLPWP